MTIYVSDLLNMSGGVPVGGGGVNWKMISINTIASVGDGYIIDTASGVITLTLPPFPQVGDQIGVADYNKNFETNNGIISRNDHKIMGLSEDFVCDVNDTSILFVYTGITYGWKILNGI